MPTSSITKSIIIDNPKEVKKFIEALEEAERNAVPITPCANLELDEKKVIKQLKKQLKG